MNLAKLFKKLSVWPGGKYIFSKIASNMAPYFNSISPLIVELTEIRCVVFVKKRRKVQNHLGTMHAIAMCNACELAFGMTMEAGLAQKLRWIPKGMTVRYLKKAQTNLIATCDFPQLSNIGPGDHQVPVTVRDLNNEIVMDALITVYVSERPQK